MQANFIIKLYPFLTAEIKSLQQTHREPLAIKDMSYKTAIANSSNRVHTKQEI